MPARISSRILQGLKELGTLTDPEFCSFSSALLNASPSLTVDDLEQEIKANLDETVYERSRPIVTALMGFFSAQEAHGLAIDDILKDVAEVLKETEIESNIQILIRSRLSELLAAPGGLRLLVKAVGVLSDHQCSYVSARTLTDVRPIFSLGSDQSKIVGNTIVHTLKIEYREAYDTKIFYVALDTKDLKKLKDILLRAAEKQELLTEMLKGTNIPLLEVH